MSQKQLITAAYNCSRFPTHYLIEKEGTFYLEHLHSHDKRPVSQQLAKSLVDSGAAQEVSSYIYPISGWEKIGGYDIDVGRPATQEELDKIFAKYGITEDTKTEPFVDHVGKIYGEYHQKAIACIQIKVEGNPIVVADAIKKAGIYASNPTPHRVTIRVSDDAIKTHEVSQGKPSIKDKLQAKPEPSKGTPAPMKAKER